MHSVLQRQRAFYILQYRIKICKILFENRPIFLFIQIFRIFMNEMLKHLIEFFMICDTSLITDTVVCKTSNRINTLTQPIQIAVTYSCSDTSTCSSQALRRTWDSYRGLPYKFHLYSPSQPLPFSSGETLVSSTSVIDVKIQRTPNDINICHIIKQTWHILQILV